MGRLLCRLFGHAWENRTTRRGRIVVQCHRCRLVSMPLTQTAEILARWGRPPRPSPRPSGA